MALVQYSIGTFHGSIGGLTCSGSSAKSKPRHKKSTTPSQNKSQAYLTELRDYWIISLTTAQRAAWQSAIAYLATAQLHGAKLYTKGQTLFTAINLTRLHAGLTIIADPPTSNTVGVITGAAITAQSGAGGHVHVTNTAIELGPHDYILWRITGPRPPATRYPHKGIRLLPGYGTPNTTDDITAYWVSKFGTLPSSPGNFIYGETRVINSDTGIVCAPFPALAYFS